MPAKPMVRGPLTYTDARSPAQALAAARAVHECRIIVQRAKPVRDVLVGELYDFEMDLYRLADSLAARQRKPRKK